MTATTATRSETETLGAIRRLPEGLVNRIAAGEVIERPAAVVKELAENALDAGARHIDVVLRAGGRVLIAVTDDGCGMSPEELSLAVERHATSKLPDDDLVNIATLGFRGEALPSIAAVSRMTVTSRPAGAAEAARLIIEGGKLGPIEPAAGPKGTRIEVRDLFYATPARLKFLKSARAELDQARDALARLAMAHPDVGFTLADENRRLLDLAPASGALFESRLSRLAAIMGRDFAENALPIEAEREGLRLTGYIGLPTLNRGTARAQYLFVNGRPVRDRLLHGAVRGAYQDFLARDRHPLVALFLEVPPAAVDVNVHPAKAEVRFREAGLVRGLIVGACKHALAEAGHRASTSVAETTLHAFRPGQGPAGTAWRGGGPRLTAGLAEAAATYHAPIPGLDAAPGARSQAAVETQPQSTAESLPSDYPLGAARAQVHATYIVSQTDDGIVIVDQHAAHERLVYERMKQALAASGVARQLLLLPEVVELEEPAVARLGRARGRTGRARLGARSLRRRRRRGARGAGAPRRGRRAGPGARSRRRAGRAGGSPGAQGAAGNHLRHHGLPRLGAGRTPSQQRRDERDPAPDGGDTALRSVQSRPADLCRAEAGRHREALRPAVTEESRAPGAAPGQIYVDADACPVKREIYKVAERHALTVLVVSNSILSLPREPWIKRVVVGEGFDEADDWIAERATQGDIVITADIPLASRCVKAGATVLGPDGRAFTEDSVGMALATRNLKQELARSRYHHRRPRRLHAARPLAIPLGVARGGSAFKAWQLLSGCRAQFSRPSAERPAGPCRRCGSPAP